MPVMTEEEARGKWCPSARVVGGVIHTVGDYQYRVSGSDSSFNRIAFPAATTTPPGSNCLGSACAAWEWFDGPEVDAATRRGYCAMLPSIKLPAA